ncbi:MAG: CinA family protein, partial [Gemmiger sp.]|nr:CinA family protein [Gemmiger sp.]
MVNTQLKILRVFGPTAAEVSAVLRQARADGCPGLRLLERDGEFAVCIQISAPNRAMAEQYCEKWALRLRAKFGDDVFAEGETSLAQATLSAMLDRRKLLVAVDETTGRLLGSQLQPLPHSEAVFDFGTETYAHPENRKQIVVPPVLLKRFPGDVVQASAGRALNAMQAAGADFGVAYMPATVGQCPFVLVCDRHGAAACALPPDLSDAAIANQILDLLRRRLLGLRLTDSCIIFRPGKERPLLLVSEAGRERGNTVRFSLRRRTPPADDPTTSFEPMMDFDTAQPVPPAQPAAPAAPKPQPPIEVPLTVPRVPTGTIRFEEEPAVQTAEPEEDFTVTMQPEPTPADEAAPPEPRRGAPAPSILDDDVPDFSAGLDPAAIAQAQIADDALRAAGKNTDVDAFAQAANRLFETSAAEEPAPPRKKRRSAAPMQDTLPQNAIRTRSLEVIEKTERRRKRTAILTLLTLLLVVLAGAGGVWLFVHNDLGARPAAKNYGTTIYDETADRYLQKALTRRSGAVGYLGFAGRPGTLVYAADAPAPETDKDAADLVRFASPSALNSTAAGNTILSCQSDAFADFAQEEIAKQNNAFTLYLQEKTYRCKLLSVFYYDPAETGDGAFDLYATGDLSQYYDYASFVSGIQARSLWNTGADAGDDSRFITLTTQSDEDGVLLCIVGRVVEEGESAAVSTASFSAAEQPLLTAVQYSRRSQPMPDVAALVSAGLGQYAKQNLGTGAKANHAAGSPSSESTDLSGAVSELQQMTSSIMASTDTLIKGLTDLAQNGKGGTVEDDLNQGAAGTLPEQTITVDQLVSQKPTPAPTPEATSTPDTPAPEPGSDQPTPTPAPEATPTPAPAAETINVTMNGTAQTMDLVQCLA